jgi:hypothetical protein
MWVRRFEPFKSAGWLNYQNTSFSLSPKYAEELNNHVDQDRRALIH